MIGIIDYGLGNIKAFVNVYKNLNITISVINEEKKLRGVDKIILPGVGDFDHAMNRLEASGMRSALDEMVLENKVPVLGICVGMQMLADSSEEGILPGLGYIKGRVKRFSREHFTKQLPVPHMGWNKVTTVEDNKLLMDLGENSKFYFLHSYYFDCDSKNNSLAVAEYGNKFDCVVHAANVYGVQFHPEKSHRYGTQLLKNFASL